MLDSMELLHTTPFRRLDKWYVEYYLNSTALDSKYNMLKLASIITPVKRRIKKSNYDGVLPVVSKIVFKSGEIIFRKENKTGMDLLHVKKGDLLVSSINFHQGAVALNNIGDFVCSTHYQTYSIDAEKILPEYLVYVLRSSCFISMVAGIKANGIKNESGYDFIGGFEIPVPTIEEQQNILDAYHAKLQEAEDNIKNAHNYNDGLLLKIQAEVSDYEGSMHKKPDSNQLVQTVPFSEANRWEVEYILKEGKLEKIYKSFKYPEKKVKDLQKESLFGLSLKASLTQKTGMIPMLRMPNIVNGEIDCSQLKYLPRHSCVTKKEPDKWLLRKGDFLINRTNSKELVGKSAVFHLDGEYTYASYVIRYRFDTSIVMPEYVNILFMLPLVREQIDAVSRQTAGQCNINSDEIGAIRIPVPSLDIQEKIVKQYNAAKDGADKYYEQAQECQEAAISNFEKEIFS